MALAKWSENFATGLPVLDRQHQEFFRRVHMFHGAVERGEGRETVGGSFRYLTDYVALHFREEEAQMERAGYPGLTAHRLFHDKLSRKVIGLLQQFDNGQMIMTTEISHFLADWLAHHIREQDMAYVPWLKAKGLGQSVLKT